MGLHLQNLDWGSSARTDTLVAEQQPTNGAGRDEGEDRECASIHQSDDHDLDRYRHQECEDRTEYGRRRDDKPYDPGGGLLIGGPRSNFDCRLPSTAAVSIASHPCHLRRPSALHVRFPFALVATTGRARSKRRSSRAIAGVARDHLSRHLYSYG